MADEKDRRSRMQTSSMHAPAKKNGAGGNYTWGASSDVTDFESSGATASKVTTAPAAEQPKKHPENEAEPPKMDNDSFPALPGRGAGQEQTRAPTANGAWSQPPGGATQIARLQPQPGGLLGLLRAYDACLKVSPLKTKVLTAAIINMFSEVLSRRFTKAPGSAAATLRQAVIGMGLTVAVHKWYAVLEGFFKGWAPEAASTVAVKTALHMTFLEPLLGATYLTSKKLLSGEFDIASTLREQLLKITISAWSVWGPTSVMQYRFVPTDYRTLVNSFVSLVYTAYLIATTTEA